MKFSKIFHLESIMVNQAVPVFIAIQVSVVFFFVVCTSGCAVAMASKGPTEKDVSVLNVGTERERVVAELGAPVLSDDKDGRKVDTFNFIQG